MPISIIVIFELLMGSACYLIAEKKGLRYPWLWFLSGITLNVLTFALLHYAINYMSRKQEDATHDEFT